VSRASDVSSFLDSMTTLPRQQVLLRGVIPVGTVAFLVLIRAAGGNSHPLLLTGVVVLGVAAGLVPASSAPLFLLLSLGGLWAISLTGSVDFWLLLAALVALAVHVAATLASYGPPALILDGGLLALWARRYATLAAVTALTWVVAALLSALDLPGSDGVIALALGVLLVWLVLVSVRFPGRPDDAP
jgi:hypothetical protein